MDILVGEHEKTALLEFISSIKSTFAEWQVAEIKLDEEAARTLGIRSAARMVYRQFSTIPGKIVICNQRELFLLMKFEQKQPHRRISADATGALEGFACDVFVDDLSAKGLSKLEIRIMEPKKEEPPQGASLAERRRSRLYNLIFVIDDDYFIRNLIEKAFRNHAVVRHFPDHHNVAKAYRNDAPDMVLLDFHFPDRDGNSILAELQEMDSEAYVVMLSADSTKGNVLRTVNMGARGFLPKPFTVQKLMEYYKQCPTIA